MELIRGLHNLGRSHVGCVATVGNFDGVHLGHAAILEQLQEHAVRLGVPATVILFEPQPREFFSPLYSPARIMTLREKVETLATLGVDRLLCVRFDKGFASQSPREFCQDFLVSGLGIRHLVVGDDFRFGQDRSGDFATLEATGASCGFGVEDTRTYEVNGRRVSSTWVREALEAADFSLAAQLLGRPFSMAGRVVHGDKIGRTLGIPTANVWPNRLRSPLHGVYAVNATVDGRTVPAVANVGPRPTVGGLRWRVETHLLDFSGDLYGKRLAVTFLAKLRDEQKFSGLDELKARIRVDIETARDFFKRMV